jgi:hypothetical protein
MPSGDITPGRATRLHLDLPSTVAVDGAWGGCRYGDQVATIAAAALGKDSGSTENMRYWPGARAWTLTPLQEWATRYQEALPAGVTSDDFLLSPGLLDSAPLVDHLGATVGLAAVQAIWNVPFGVGMNVTPGVLEVGDPLTYKQITAGQSWEGLITSSVPVAGPQDGTTLPLPNVPLDCLLYTNINEREDQGYYLRWVVPGTPLHYPDWVMNFFFGQYALAVTGDGMCHLCEYCRPYTGSAGGGSYRWQLRRSMRYCRPSLVCNTTHTMTIFPVRGRFGQKYIEFYGNNMESSVLALGARAASALEETYEAEPIIRGFDTDEAPGYVTKAAPARIDVRRDLRVGWQLSRLVFSPTAGKIIDAPWTTPQFTTPRPVRIRADFRLPDLLQPGMPGVGTVATILSDTRTGAILDPTSAIASQSLTLEIDLIANTVHDSPVFYGYDLRRDPYTMNITPGELATSVRTYAGQVMADDPSLDRADIQLYDPTDALQKLRQRGQLDAKVTTTALVPDGEGGTRAAQITLFRGMITRPRRTRLGKATQPERFFPSTEWSLYNLPLEGMAARLRELNNFRLDFRIFGADEDAAVDPYAHVLPPWKVTDVIRYLLCVSGIDPLFIDIDDNPLRLWVGGGLDDQQSDLWYDPNVDVLDRILALARNYLGARLVYDLSAGVLAPLGRTDAGSPEGAWRLLYPAAPDAPPVLNFAADRTDGTPVAVAGPHAYLSPAAFPPDPDNGAPTTFFTGPADSYVVPPEANHVYVFTVAEGITGTKPFRIDRHRYNFKSYAVPRSGLVPDPTSPHYIGREKLLLVPAPELWIDAGREDDFYRAKSAVNLVAERLLNYACRARLIQPVHAPLAVLQDGDTGRWRIPRYGDPVTFRGEAGWFIRSVSPDYEYDVCQMAHYELERLEPL